MLLHKASSHFVLSLGLAHLFLIKLVLIDKKRYITRVSVIRNPVVAQLV